MEQEISMSVVWWEMDGRRYESAPLPADEAEMRLSHLRNIGCARISNSGLSPVEDDEKNPE